MGRTLIFKKKSVGVYNIMCIKLCMCPNSTLWQGCLPYFILQLSAIIVSIDFGDKRGFQAMESTLYHCIVGLFIESSTAPKPPPSLPTTTSTTSSIGCDYSLASLRIVTLRYARYLHINHVDTLVE